ncbi:MAG: hypothetical protein Q9168_003685 [Polycauliona sp. 1 TL-2023]
MPRTFTREEREELTGSFTQREIEAVASTHSHEQLEAILAIRGRNQDPSTKTVPKEGLADTDAEGDSDDLDAAPRGKKEVNPRSAKRIVRPPRQQTAMELAYASAHAPKASDRLARPTHDSSLSQSSSSKDGFQQKFRRTSKNDRSISNSSGRQDRPNLADPNRLSSMAFPTPKPTSRKARTGRAPTEQERQDALDKADMLETQLKRGSHSPNERTNMQKEIQRWTLIAEGGDIEPSMEKYMPLSKKRNTVSGGKRAPMSRSSDERGSDGKKLKEKKWAPAASAQEEKEEDTDLEEHVGAKKSRIESPSDDDVQELAPSKWHAGLQKSRIESPSDDEVQEKPRKKGKFAAPSDLDEQKLRELHKRDPLAALRHKGEARRKDARRRREEDTNEENQDEDDDHPLPHPAKKRRTDGKGGREASEDAEHFRWREGKMITR